MSKVALASIRSLTFYDDALTMARRTDPIPQLNCVGKACSLYTPEVVRCTNVGGHGADIDWKCEADLPEALRFGRVEVSCEGWSGPNDPFVLKGSCALNYRLVQVPDSLRNTNAQYPKPFFVSRWLHGHNLSGIIFLLLWWGLVLYILYAVLKSCLTGSRNAAGANNRPRGPGGGFTWFPGTSGDQNQYDPPPPYSKHTASTRGDWQPGFWTGAAAGSLGTYLLNRNRQRDTTEPRTYDWERRAGSSFSYGDTSPRRTFSSDDRGESSSTGGLGAIRRSTGIGGSHVR